MATKNECEISTILLKSFQYPWLLQMRSVVSFLELQNHGMQAEMENHDMHT